MKTRIMLLNIAFLLGMAGICQAQESKKDKLEKDPNKQADLFEMPLEKLMEVEVISASRQPTRPQYLSAPVTVITAEDIHYSGLTTIPEILQFSPGVDVRRLDRQRYIVGVRGLFG
ncbi:MAG: hypothetical protein MUO89_01795, partial [Dehalococcoidia bacterium]|nr:hypothetical protein [Dehalococcoidia bacterium]